MALQKVFNSLPVYLFIYIGMGNGIKFFSLFNIIEYQISKFSSIQLFSIQKYIRTKFLLYFMPRWLSRLNNWKSACKYSFLSSLLILYTYVYKESIYRQNIINSWTNVLFISDLNEIPISRNTTVKRN